jgi:hypothetical protein
MNARDTAALGVRSSVEELLKSARSVYLVLIGVCAAVALFAASPREVQKYVNAQKCLNTLRMIDFGDFVHHEQDLLQTATSKLSWLQPPELFPNGRIETSLSPLDLFSVTYGPDPSQGTVDELLKFFETKHPVKILLPDEQDAAFKDFLRVLVTFAKASPQPELRLLSFKPDPDSHSPTSLSAYAVYSSTGAGAAPVLEKSVRARELTVVDDAFRSWFRSVRQFQNLLLVPGALESLRDIENEISGMKLNEAARYLETRIAFTNRKINVLGASIDEPLAIIGGPVVVLLPLIYLLLLSWRLANLPSPVLATAQDYAWIVLFPRWQGNAVREVSVMLPIAVCIWLFYTSAESAASMKSLFVSASIIVLVCLNAILLRRQFCVLGQKIGSI